MSKTLDAPEKGVPDARETKVVQPRAVQLRRELEGLPYQEQLQQLRPPRPLAIAPEPVQKKQTGIGSSASVQCATSSHEAPTAVQKVEDAPTAEQAERIRKMSKMRDGYEAEVKALRAEASSMLGSGKTEEEVARHVSARRREIGIKYKDLTPADKRQQIYERNLAKYGDKLGPTPDYLRSKGRSWQDIIDGACKPGGEDIIPKLLAAGLGRPDLEATILAKRGGGVAWHAIICELTKGK